MRMTVVEMSQIGLNLFKKLIAHHVIANFDCRAETFSSGTAMAFDHNAAHAEQHATIHFVRVHLSRTRSNAPFAKIYPIFASHVRVMA